MLKVILVISSIVTGQQPQTELHEMPSMTACFAAARQVMDKNKPTDTDHTFGAGCLVMYERAA